MKRNSGFLTPSPRVQRWHLWDSLRQQQEESVPLSEAQLSTTLQGLATSLSSPAHWAEWLSFLQTESEEREDELEILKDLNTLRWMRWMDSLQAGWKQLQEGSWSTLQEGLQVLHTPAYSSTLNSAVLDADNPPPFCAGFVQQQTFTINPEEMLFKVFAGTPCQFRALLPDDGYVILLQYEFSEEDETPQWRFLYPSSPHEGQKQSAGLWSDRSLNVTFPEKGEATFLVFFSPVPFEQLAPELWPFDEEGPQLLERNRWLDYLQALQTHPDLHSFPFRVEVH